MPSGRCKVPYLPGVWAVMVSNWSRVRGHAPILRPHRVRHRSEPVRRRSARRFLDSLSRRAASIPDSRPVRWSSPSALTAGCGTSAASKSPQSSANSRIQFWDNTRSGGERADVGGHDEGAPAELRIQRASRRDARSDHCGVYAGHLRILRQALEALTRCIREVSRSAGTNCGAWMRGTGIPVLRDMRSTVADSLAA